jgi:hypothetical protein
VQLSGSKFFFLIFKFTALPDKAHNDGCSKFHLILYSFLPFLSVAHMNY